MKKIRFVCILFLIAGCATQTYSIKKNDRIKALALLSEHAPSILSVAEQPLGFYCKKGKWPAPETLPTVQAAFINLINLHYVGPVHEGYAATFQLRSFIPHDPFISYWTMSIATPDRHQQTTQLIPLTLIEKDLNIHLRIDLRFSC